MKTFFTIFSTILFSLSLTSCVKDVPSVSFPQSSYMIPAAGGELIIPVRSTGVDDVKIDYSDNANWEIAENGDMIPSQGWIEVVKVINDYQSTRELAEWTSGVVINVKPNTNKYERRAVITVESFTASDAITITQPAAFVK